MRKLGVKWEPNYWREHNLPDSGCFGYVNGHLVLGKAHHQLIMSNFLYKGWTMEQLFMAPQAWGWFTVNPIQYYDQYFPNKDDMKKWQQESSFVLAQFTSDAGLQMDEEVQAALGAFSSMYHLPARLDVDSKVRGVVEENFATGLRGLDNMEKYLERPEYYYGPDIIGTNPHVLHGVPQPPGAEWDPEWIEEALKPEDETQPEPPPKPVTKMPVPVPKNEKDLYGIYDMPGTDTKLEYVGPGEAYWVNGPLGTKHKVYDLNLIPMWIAGYQLTKQKGKEVPPFTGYEGVYLNSMHPETSNHLHVTPDFAVWKHPTTGDNIGQSVLSPESIISQIDNGNLEKMPGNLGGFYQGDGFSVHYDAETNKATWTYSTGTQIGPSYVSPKMVLKYINEGSWDWVAKDESSEPTLPGFPFQVGDKVLYNPDQDKPSPTEYEISSIAPDEIKIIWPGMHSDGVEYSPEQFMKTFTKIAYTPGGKTKGWGDIMEKANYIRSQNGVNIINNEPQHVTGTVMSATDPSTRGPYNTEIWRDDPNSQAITMWDCDCDWDQFAWGRTRQWKKYEGRPCCHVLALFWNALQDPPQGAQTAPVAPPTPTPGGGVTVNQGLIAPVGQPPMNVPLTGPDGEPVPMGPEPAGPTNPAAMPWSEVVQPGKGEGTITFPGTFSHWKEASEPRIVGDDEDGYYDKAIPFYVGNGKVYPGEEGQYHSMILDPWEGVWEEEDNDDDWSAGRYWPKDHKMIFYNNPTEENVNGALEHFSGKEASAPTEPPNYRKKDRPNEKCGLCKMMYEGKCWGYGNKPVEEDMVCDSFTPEPRSKEAAGYPWEEYQNWSPGKAEEHKEERYIKTSDGKYYYGQETHSEIIAEYNIHPADIVDAGYIMPGGYHYSFLDHENAYAPYLNNPNYGQPDPATAWTEASLKTAVFQNGDIVRVWEDTQGYAQPAYGQPGYPVTIKKNQSGEVLSSDDNISVVIFPLDTGPLEHHLVKVECPTSNLYLDNTNAQPFIKRKAALSHLEALQALENWGGFSLTANKEVADPNGYFCALKGYEYQVPLNQLTPEVIKGYIQSHAQELASDANLLVGAWLNGAICYFDLSKKFFDLEEAMGAAKQNDQLAIWDGIHQQEIPVPKKSSTNLNALKMFRHIIYDPGLAQFMTASTDAEKD